MQLHWQNSQSDSYEWACPTFSSDCGFIWVKKTNILGDIPLNLDLLGQIYARNKYAITCNSMFSRFKQISCECHEDILRDVIVIRGTNGFPSSAVCHSD